VAAAPGEQAGQAHGEGPGQRHVGDGADEGRPLKPIPYPVTTTMARASTTATSSLPPER
jgi:hypothetical protein